MHSGCAHQTRMRDTLTQQTKVGETKFGTMTKHGIDIQDVRTCATDVCDHVTGFRNTYVPPKLQVKIWACNEKTDS